MKNTGDIGQKIRYYRIRAGMSQLELELLVHAAQGSISRIESGKVNPTKETIWAIARTLQLTNLEIASLFGIYQLETIIIKGIYEPSTKVL